MAVRMDGAIYVITQFNHVTPGNLRAFVQVKLKRVSDGTSIEKRLRSNEDIDKVDLDRRDAEYLYCDSTGHVFMDSETFDQFALDADLLGDAMLFVKPNTTLTVLVAEGKPSAIELPPTVELTVADTTPAIKGATATNQLKDATMETGLKTRVPPFIVVGERLRITTADGSYQGRA